MHPQWFDGQLPSDRQVGAMKLLVRAAHRTPEAMLLHDSDGHLSYAEMVAMAARAATGLVSRGVGRGDIIAIALPNTRELVAIWLGTQAIGAIPALLNPDLRGMMLSDALARLQPRIVVMRLPRSAAAARPKGYVFAEDPAALIAEPAAAQRLACANAPDAADIGAILMTSGTTGPSKAVLCRNGQLYAAGMTSHGYLKATDHLFLYTPLFHTLGLSSAIAAIAVGGSFFMQAKFSARTLWNDIAAAGCNRIVALLTALTTGIADRVEGDQAPFDFAMMSPISAKTVAFAARQAFHYFAAYNMTELSVPLLTTVDSQRIGSCGSPRAGIKCRIVAPDGTIVEGAGTGELQVRAEDPDVMMAGYLGDPTATELAWRDGWFATGDIFTRDSDGHFQFEGRGKDTIRRRGENVSAFEVERELLAHEHILDAAVIAVPLEGGEEEIAAFILSHKQRLDFAELTSWLLDRCPRHMVPRFFMQLDDMPRTVTGKARKEMLRESLTKEELWDRETTSTMGCGR